MNPNTIHKAFIIQVSAVAALGGLLFGFDTAIISGTISYLTAYFSLSDLMLGWAVGCILIGCAIGAILAGKLADLWGRKKVLILCALLFAISGLGAGLSHNLFTFVFFRLIGGLGVGAAAMVSPMYIAESVPASWRGRLVSLYQLGIVSGILLAYCSNYFFDSMQNNWRWMFASQLAPSLLFLILLLRVPESPRWLVAKGRTKDAFRILKRSTGADAAQQALTEIQDSFQNQTASNFKTEIRLLFSKAYRKVLFIGILVAVFQQITGINSIFYYAPVIFKQTGLDGSSSILQTIGLGIINVISAFLAIGFVDRVGRKRFLLWGSIIMGVSLTAIALCFQYQYFDNYIVLIFMLLYVGAFACTLGAVTWVYLSEVFPNRVRGIALSLATLSLWLADFIVTYSFPYMTSALGTSITLYTYAACCAIAFVFFLFRLPETKGKSLEEIEHLFI